MKRVCRHNLVPRPEFDTYVLFLCGQTEAAMVDPAGWTAPTSTELLWGENQKIPEGAAEGAEAGRPLVEDRIYMKQACPCSLSKVTGSGFDLSLNAEPKLNEL